MIRMFGGDINCEHDWLICASIPDVIQRVLITRQKCKKCGMDACTKDPICEKESSNA